MAYRRLLPRERGIFTYAELWAEDDHLLSVKSYRLTSAYQRFPLSEIQGLSITALPHWTVWQIAWLTTATLAFSVGVLAPALPGLKIFFGLVTIWPLLLAVREVLLGPRCRAAIHTATGVHAVPAVARAGRGQTFLDTVTPLIEGVQGRAERLEVTARPLTHPEDAARLQLAEHRPLRLITFGLLIVEALYGLATWRWPKLESQQGSFFLTFGLAITTIALLLVVWRNATPVLRRERAYLLSGVALGLILAEFVAFVIAWCVTLQAPQWISLIGAAWRLPLALAGIALELRRK